ncbi:helix-turn-helix domain-containing protein [Klebsiella michiganensis]|uniref:helix-turn-helix domain-containing protein n=1 Tax=Klebsiella michiganensis TaxID=1134687 RepID=UPI00255B2AE4|nr:helix-turn-helix transcriptional regulator [Klebsiella michiganensis]MDL4445091.1 helix-turn-helix transcriptional regulator [Klebsiella michiganensis]MDL4486017.1 helix-turn-helix transcriptional regulator [Klebsiella michiganensis]MDL4660856.1 helix-turn-helix transcriptional regulator [Klebsiella michiganensis]
MYKRIESQKCSTNGTTTCDWHRADIIAELRKKGTSLASLSRNAGLNARTLNNALDRRYPKGERIIASAIGVEPAVIWPSRYSEVA